MFGMRVVDSQHAADHGALIMTMPQRYTFGPVPSRRLGRSLGVDVIPKKVCCYDCIYCEVGPTTQTTVSRKEYYPCNEVVAEIQSVIAEKQPVDWITFSGSGEPTLNSKLGTMIHEIKQWTEIPVAVITNGALLFLQDVRNDLLEADAVLPSLDAASPVVFNRINRPHASLEIKTIIEGLRAFRREYHGDIWLEILFVLGVNESSDEVARIKQIIDEVQPDKVHLNTVVRPPAESLTQPLDIQRLKEIQKLIGGRCEIIGKYNRCISARSQTTDREAILGLLQRRPMTVEGLAIAFDAPASGIRQLLGELEQQRLVDVIQFDEVEYFGIRSMASETPKRSARS